MTAQTLLNRIGWRLGSPEQVAVQALSHILSLSGAARGTIEDTLRRGATKGGPIVGAAARSTGQTEKRLTLAALDDRGAERLCVEAVFWRGRAAFEPPQHPPHDRPAAVMFVVPTARRETFWTGLCNETVVELSSVDQEDEPWSAATGDGLRLLLISWKTLLGRMADATHASGETQAEFDIRQLRDFARQHEETDFLPLRPDELHRQFPRRVRGLIKLISDAVERVSRKGWENKGWQQWSKDRCHVRMGLFGLNIRFGIDLHLWASHGTTPLWLTVQTSDNKPGSLTVEEAHRRLESLLVEVDDWTRGVPIGLPVGVEENEVLDAVVRRLDEIAHTVAQKPGYRP